MLTLPRGSVEYMMNNLWPDGFIYCVFYGLLVDFLPSCTAV